ncbi:MAG: L-threonylcarbamoyladenylate synthase [Cytophagales bacterium]
MSKKIGTDIQIAKKLLVDNKLVAIPTETVYGLAGNALNPDAVAQIFAVKNRPFFDPLILHTDNFEKIRPFLKAIPEKAQKLADTFWPGPLTLVLNKTSAIPDICTSGLSTVGVRIPNHKLTLELLAQLDFPLAAPSANPFKYISPTSAQHVFDQLGEQLPYILDGGNCNIGVESTIIGFSETNEVLVYRLGGLEIEKIEAVVGKVKIITNNDSNPAAPGMLKLHYSPTKKLLLNSYENICKITDPSVGFITYKNKPDSKNTCVVLSESGNINEAAANLFASMRALDASNVSYIVAEIFPDEGLGRAINDRLNRASAK